MTEFPDWTVRGGHFRQHSEPSKWFQKKQGNSAGQWNRKELVPFGKASSGYRTQYFVCPECAFALAPLQREYRFVCTGCHLVFGWGWGGLYGFGKGHERAEYAPDEK